MNLFNATIASFTQSRSIGNGNMFLSSFFGGASTEAGKKVNHNASMKISAFWCGVHAICNSIALLPKQIYTSKDDVREHLTDHPVNYLISKEPNECMTQFNFWFTMILHALVRGNGFAKIYRNGAGQVVSLEFYESHEVAIYKLEGKLWYQILKTGQWLHSDEMLHIPGFAWNGISGIGVIQYAADNLAIPLNADAFGSDAFGDRGVSYGILETDKDLQDKGRKNIAKLLNQSFNTSDKHRLAVFDEGMKYKRISLTPAEAQFIETKAAGVEDIARWLSVPKFKLHTDGEGGYNYLVEMTIEFWRSAVAPWTQKIKEEIERKLLTKNEKLAGVFCYINYKKLLEVDPKARAQYYKDMWFIRAINSNEIRKAEDMNPYKGGDEFLQPANMLSEMQLNNELQNGTKPD